MGLDEVSSTIITAPLRVDINRENGDYRDDIGAARLIGPTRRIAHLAPCVHKD